MTLFSSPIPEHQSSNGPEPLSASPKNRRKARFGIEKTRAKRVSRQRQTKKEESIRLRQPDAAA